MSQGSPAPQKVRTPLPYRFATRVVRPILALSTKVDWRGREYLPSCGGFVVAANHLSNIDPLTLMHYLYVAGHPPRMLAKTSLFSVPGLGWLMRRSGMIPVERYTAKAADSLTPATKALNEGHCVAVFPEGTLGKDPEMWPTRGKTGAVRMAVEAGCPLIPVAQWGAQNVLPRGSKFPKFFRRIPMIVQAGPPVDLSDLNFGDHSPDSETLRIATNRVMAAITRLLSEIRGEEPPSGPSPYRDDENGANSSQVPADPVASSEATTPEQGPSDDGKETA